jgi:hypothetical protein
MTDITTSRRPTSNTLEPHTTLKRLSFVIWTIFLAAYSAISINRELNHNASLTLAKELDERALQENLVETKRLIKEGKGERDRLQKVVVAAAAESEGEQNPKGEKTNQELLQAKINFAHDEIQKGSRRAVLEK